MNVSIAPTIHGFADDAALVNKLTSAITERLEDAINLRGAATLAVPGGRTPVRLFEALSQQELDWSRIIVILVDERWVAKDSLDSNENLVRNKLLQNKAADAKFIGLYHANCSVKESSSLADQNMASLSWPLDVILLGMGEDGHIASLFPGAKGLPSALDLNAFKRCFAIHPIAAPYPRLSLGLGTLINSRHVILYILGEKKRQVLSQAQDNGPVDDLPVRGLLQHYEGSVEIYHAPASDGF